MNARIIQILVSVTLLSFTLGKEPLPSKIGLIAIYTDRSWQVSDMQSITGSTTPAPINPLSFIASIKNPGSLDHSLRLQSLRQFLFALKDTLPIQYVSEETILNAPVYTEKIKKIYNKQGGVQSLPGYIPVVYTDRFSIEDAMTIEETMDAVMISWVKYDINVYNRAGDAGNLSVKAYLNVHICKKDGKKIKWMGYGTSSNMTFSYSRMFNESDLDIYCTQALDKAKLKLQEEFKKY